VDLGLGADELGIALPSANLVVDTTLQFNLVFGVFTSGETPVNQDFFVVMSPMIVSASGTLDLGGGDINTALAGAGLASQVLAQPASGRVQLVSQASPRKSLEITRTLTMDSRISYSDLQSQSLGNLVSANYNADSSVSANLPVTVKSGIGFTPSFDLALSLNPFSTAQPVIDPDT
jgi:hypothetical protein